MMTHTLTTLGPKVLASRMVRDYTEQLYGPAARAGWASNGPGYAGARDARGIQGQGPRCLARASTSTTSSPLASSDSPQVGEILHVRAYVSLGELTPDEVEVQVVHGHAQDSDDLHRRRGRVAGLRGVLRGGAPPVRR